MKKKFSLFLVLVFMFSLFAPIERLTVQAAVVPLSVHINNYLELVNNDYTPRHSANMRNDRIMVSWPMPSAFVPEYERYELTWPIPTDTGVNRGVLTVTNLGGSGLAYMVDFNVQQWVPATSTTLGYWEDVNEMYKTVPGPTSMADPMYSIYSPGQGAGFYNLYDFFMTRASFNPGDNPRVNNRNQYPEYSSKPPTDNPNILPDSHINLYDDALPADKLYMHYPTNRQLETRQFYGWEEPDPTDPTIMIEHPPIDELDPYYFARLTPSFDVRRGFGYSFKVDFYNEDYIISFVWGNAINQSDTNFYVSIEGVRPGLMYEFALTYQKPVLLPTSGREYQLEADGSGLTWPSDPTKLAGPGRIEYEYDPDTDTNYHRVLTGLDLRTFAAIPLAEVDDPIRNAAGSYDAGYGRAVRNAELEGEPDFFFNRLYPGWSPKQYRPGAPFDTSLHGPWDDRFAEYDSITGDGIPYESNYINAFDTEILRLGDGLGEKDYRYYYDDDDPGFLGPADPDDDIYRIDKTADGDLGLSVRFDLPLIYNRKHNIFVESWETTIGSDNDIWDYDQDVTSDVLDFAMLLGGNITVTLRDILRNLPVIDMVPVFAGDGSSATGQSAVGINRKRDSTFIEFYGGGPGVMLLAASRIMGYNPANTLRNVETNRAEILIKGMPPGELYTISGESVVISLTSRTPGNLTVYNNPVVVTSATGTDRDQLYRPVFSFMEYNVHYLSDGQYAFVIPYSLLRGEYRMIVGYPAAEETYARQEELLPSILSITKSAGEPLYFPLSVSFNNGIRFQIQYTESSFSDTSAQIVYSQIAEFWPEEKQISIGTPQNFRIIKSSANPMYNINLRQKDDDPSGNTADLDFWVQWDIAGLDSIEYLVGDDIGDKIFIDYDLFRVLSPLPPPDGMYPGPDELFLSIRVHIERVALPDPITGERGLEVTYEIIDYGPLGVGHTEIPDIYNTSLRMLTDSNQTCYVEIPLSTDASHQDSGVIFLSQFHYPSIYFMNVSTMFLNLTGDPLNESLRLGPLMSQYDYMTLNDFSDLMVPPPVNLTVQAHTVRHLPNADEDKPEIIVSYDIPTSGIKQIVNEKSQTRYPEITVNLYIGQYEQIITDRFYPEFGGSIPMNERIELCEMALPFDESIWAVDEEGDPIPGYIDFEAAHAGHSFTSLRDAMIYGTRTGVVAITNIPLFDPSDQTNLHIPLYDLVRIRELIEMGEFLSYGLTFTGLDKNQQYYVFMDLTLTFWDILPAGEDPEEGEPTRVIIEYDLDGNEISRSTLVVWSIGEEKQILESVFTSLEGVTTADDVNMPSDVERVPIAPQNLGRRDVTQDAVTIFWDKVLADPPMYEDPSDLESLISSTSIEYEIIRTKDTQIEDSLFRSSVSSFSEVFDSITNPEKTGWMVNNEEDLAYLYNPSSRTFIQEEDSERYDYNPIANVVTFRDKTLKPNQVYFYYVRTVRVVTIHNHPSGEMVRRIVSSWSRVTVTTDTIRAPENLRVETSRDDYNRHNEVVVSFDMPVESMTEFIRFLGTEYDFEFGIREDDGTWGFLPRAQLTRLEATLNPDGQSVKFFYKLTGLKPGTLYSLRVRLFDMIHEDASMYTNVVQFVTDMDQDEYDDEISTGDWLNFLRRELEELLKLPYWVTFESNTQMVVVQRPGAMFTGVLQTTPDAQILLHAKEVDSLIYYLPASVVFTANAREKGFKLSFGDMDILMPPRMLNEFYNDTMLVMASYLNNKSISDYYVRISVTRATVTTLVDNYPALSRQTRVEFDAIGTIQSIGNISQWDLEQNDNFAKRVYEKLDDPDLRDDFYNRIRSDATNEELSAHAARIVRDIRNELMGSVHGQLNGNTGIFSSRSAPFRNYDLPLRLVSANVNPNTNINGYQWQTITWQGVNVYEQNPGKAMLTSVPGMFVFAGRAVNIPGIESVQGGGSITAFTAKYGLEDYLGSSAVVLSNLATRNMVAGSVARMAGAPKTADPINWISSNLNMTMSSRNANGNVQAQEAVAMVMALYEAKSGTKVSSITIRNLTHTANMTGLDSRYTQAVRAAIELGIINPSGFAPSGFVSIGDLLNMLGQLDQKVKL